MNKIILIGRLTRDLEPKNAKSGMLYVNFTLAVNRRVKTGEEKKADFFKFLHKGSQIAVEGRGQFGKYQDKDGNNREKFSVQVDSVEFLSDGAPKQRKSADPLDDEFDGGTDMDIPF